MYEGQKIRITSTRVKGLSNAYGHLSPGTIHTVVPKPERGRPNGAGGVWVMGRGKLVYVFKSEYELIK